MTLINVRRNRKNICLQLVGQFDFRPQLLCQMFSSNKRRSQATSSEEIPLGPPKKRYRHVVDEEEQSNKNEDDDRSDHGQSISPVSNDNSNAPKDSKAWQMMAKMGYKGAGGLGAQNQGRAEPVDVKMRSRRRGLGAEVKGLEISLNVTWDETQETIVVEESPEWIPECSLDVPTSDELDGWLKVGPKLRVIDNETHFCEGDVLSDMLRAKSVFDELSDRDLRNARARANPFESIKGAFFQNRAAMKMANLDAVFDDLFTNPKLANDKLWVPKDGNQLFYFADICAGPGGFTEYVLWRRGWTAHGFGLTLRNKDDFRLDDFLAASPEMFEPYYGKNGPDGDGDITKSENLEAFKDYVLKSTDGHGVHTVMADGGFSVEGQENLQEILSKRLYLCQTLCAMNVLRPGGSFVCKLFDIFTPFSVGLIYLLWRSFDEVCVHKPHTSRPANSERYVICKRMRDDVNPVKIHLWNANLEYEILVSDGKAEDYDVDELVPMDVLKTTEAFYDYIVQSNEKLAMRQTLYLEKYRTYARNPMLQDARQSDLRSRCMQYWKVPDDKRPQAPRPNPNNRMEELCEGYQSWISSPPLGEFDWKTLDASSQDEYRVILRTAKPAIFVALGKRFIFYFEGSRWDTVDHHTFSIPRDTVLYAELTSLIKGEGKGQMQVPVLRIFDGYCLGGENISEMPFRERRRLLGKFCAAIHKESRPDLARVCLADAWHIDQLPSLRNSFAMGKIRGGSKPVFHCSGASQNSVVRGDFSLVAQGFLIYKILKDEWKLAVSKREGRLYFFNTKTGKSVFEAPDDAFSGFIPMYVNRRGWPGSRKEQRSSSNDGERRSPEEEALDELLLFCDSMGNLKKERVESQSHSSS